MDETTREVLSLLTEDLYSPWEIALWVPVGRETLAQVIAGMIRQGLAEWFFRAHDSAPAVGWTTVGAPPPDLGDDATWTAADLASPQLLLGITDAGKTAYYSR